ncbi:hypothetical protein PIB30_015741 [Stylosanthes scabra]|uniref:Uncharacterized protein n=1 Tax=Stylosanthes scabra TaxID=79078 RepID=A0ABU6X913_9FABA|nr:hypothetical protein [Stylosanthes scabra]
MEGELGNGLRLFCQGGSWFVFAAADWEALKLWAPSTWRRGSGKHLQRKRRQHQKRNHRENHFAEGASHVDYGRRKGAPFNMAFKINLEPILSFIIINKQEDRTYVTTKI